MDEIRKRIDEHSTKMQSNGLQLQPIFSSDCCGGGGMYGGGWGGRNNLGDGEFNEELGAGRRLHLRMMQGLLAVRGGDHFLTADATLFNSRAPATNALLCINAIVYLLQVLTKGALLTAGESLIYHDNSQPLVLSHENNANMYQLAGAKINSAIVMGQYYRLLSPVFLHGGLLHLLCNALSLNAVGPMVETLFDTERMVFTYICGGIGGNVASFVFGPQAMSVGASGTAS
jgi:membrane associated rhomboid family serine protease